MYCTISSFIPRCVITVVLVVTVLAVVVPFVVLLVSYWRR
jgi:hypothetical protein